MLKIKKQTIFLLSLLILFHYRMAAEDAKEKANIESVKIIELNEIVIESSEIFENEMYCFNSEKSPNILLHKLRLKVKNKKKITAAVLAFPVPFGFFGGHRIYLGTKPVVPVVYIATLGGCFGILPLIDFVVILLNKETTDYENNSKIFMWNNNSPKK